ncbi:MAG: hypothetical protein AABW71_01655 [Nanoarchaeota archaeon]
MIKEAPYAIYTFNDFVEGNQFLDRCKKREGFQFHLNSGEVLDKRENNKRVGYYFSGNFILALQGSRLETLADKYITS